MRLDDYKKKLNMSLGKVASLQEQQKHYEEKIEFLKQRSISIALAQALVQKVAKETQDQLCYHINDIVNLCLNTCFPDEYEFKLTFSIQRGKTEAVLSFIKNGAEIDPMTASGGGVVDMACFGLRMASWSLGNTANTIVIDEGFRFLSRDLQPKAGEILKELSEKLHVQFIQVTHSPDLIAMSDKVFEVKLKDDVSQVKEEIVK